MEVSNILKSKVEENVTLEVSQRERALFKYLDELGLVATRIIEIYAPPKVLVSSNIGRELILLKERGRDEIYHIDVSALSDNQINMLTNIIKDILKDSMLIGGLDKEYSTHDVLLTAWLQDSPNKNRPVSTSGVTVLKMPVGFAIMLRTEDAAKAWGVHEGKDSVSGDTYKIKGLYTSSTERTTYTNPFEDKIIYISVYDRSSEQINNTIMHEYIHLLTNNYIWEHQLSDSTLIDSVLSKIRSEQDNITINMMHHRALHNHIPHIQQNQGRELSKDIKSLELTRESLDIDYIKTVQNSDSYITEGAKKMFYKIRNELVAYAYGTNIIFTDEDYLLPIGETFNDELNNLNSKSDKDKVQIGWQYCKDVLKLCTTYDIPPTKIAPILLTSQDFMQMAKRLAMYIDKHNGTHLITRA